MGTKRHVKRRKSMLSEQKRIVYVALIWVAVALVSVFLALLLGNILGKRAERIKRETESAFSYTYTANSVAPIRAPFLDVKSKSNKDIESKVNALANKTESVSVCLTDENGIPEYRSKVYESVAGACGSFDINSAMAFIKDKNIYVSACFLFNSFYVEDETSRNAAIAVEAAIVAEAVSAGVNDVIICDLPVTDLGISYVAKLFSEIRKLSPSAVLGASIDYDNAISASGAAAIKDYSAFADFCAIDLSDKQSEGITAEDAARSLIYLFEVYPLRLLMSTSGLAEFNVQAETLKALGITNYQAYKYHESSGSVG